jgi:para-aminobenzoate synthetase/4-amino-4-deoxychorismate lyase
MHPARFDTDDPAGRGWRARLSDPRAPWVATRLDEVRDVLAQADAAARAGAWVAVALSYEAAAAFEPALPAPRRHDADPPLAWARAFAHADTGLDSARAADAGVAAPSFVPAWTEAAFAARVRDAQARIADGDTYQVNLTFPLHAAAPDDLAGWYAALRVAQQAPYATCLDLGRHAVVSLSPELFFERRGTRITVRPMKGTLPRGRWADEDAARARELAASPKLRAENVMIVDLLRNDLGRVAVPGSVRVPALFSAERYPTVWQLTSTVEADVPATVPLVDLLAALFPCGSVTGAPKIRTMDIIDALEASPRGLYTGALGLLRPGGDATFSVAIRTIVVDRDTGTATLGVGAGITADSSPEDEYHESLLKAAFVQASTPAPFALLETLRLEDGVLVRRARHLARVAASAAFFARTFDPGRVDAALDGVAVAHPTGAWRVRLLVDADGAATATCTPYVPDGRSWRVTWAAAPIDAHDPFLCHKTTRRGVYQRARRARPHVEDVLLWNRHGEVTEGTLGNVVVEIDGERWTPPVTCGLLGGTFRAECLEAGAVRERVLRRADVARADRLWIVNSVREWIEAELVR